MSSQRFFEACRANKDIRIKNEFGFVPWNCLHLFSLKAAAVGLVFTAGWQTMNGTLELPVLLMAAMFSFTIFGSVESINDAAHILSVTDSVLDRLEELEGTELPDQDGKDISLEHYDICFDHVSFGYGTREVIHDVSFQLPQNSATAIVGPSGSGKSTLCALLARFYDVDQGRIIVGGYDIRKMTCDSLLRNIAMVFQNYALYPHMTVYENMAFGLKLRKVPKDQIDKMVKEAAKILDLEQLLDRKPKALSGGQRQRVAMGRAIVCNPKVFLMDEPLSNLDAKLRGQMRIEISKLHQRLETTIIYVTHDQTEAMTLGTRIVVMNAGVIQQVDTPQKLYEEPDNMFVAGFIGSPQMNFLDAVCQVEDDDVYLTIGEMKLRLPETKAEKLKAR